MPSITQISALLMLILLLPGCMQAENARTDAEVPHTAGLNIFSTDTSLHINNGLLLYRTTPFSGTITEKFDSSRTHAVTQYLDGRQNGMAVVFFPNGVKESLRYYTQGEKDSIHTGWWPNGSRRFEYHFNNGNYEGNFVEWYAGGAPAKLIRYSKGEELSGQGWRENGKMYMNYTMRNGRRYGLINEQLCYSLKKEQGQYVK